MVHLCGSTLLVAFNGDVQAALPTAIALGVIGPRADPATNPAERGAEALVQVDEGLLNASTGTLTLLRADGGELTGAQTLSVMMSELVHGYPGLAEIVRMTTGDDALSVAIRDTYASLS